MSQALPRVAPRRPAPLESPFDYWLIVVVAMLVSLGLVMVASASISIGARNQSAELYYFWRQVAAFGLGFQHFGLDRGGCAIFAFGKRSFERGRDRSDGGGGGRESSGEGEGAG